MTREQYIKRLQKVCKDIKENWAEPNDSHTKAEYNGMYKALDMVMKRLNIEEDDKEKYEQLAEQLVGDDATDRYTHQELINEVNRLKDIEENKD